MAKTIERMRANPNADWQITDVEKACREAGLQCIPPDGGSHYKIRSPRLGLLYVVPAHRRIKPRYIRNWSKSLTGSLPMIDRTKLIRDDGVAFDPTDYAVLVEPLSDEDGGGFFARIPALNGCVGDGETEQEAIDDVRAAALEWAASAIMHGDRLPPPLPYSLQAAE